jgi:hypothetical protein
MKPTYDSQGQNTRDSRKYLHGMEKRPSSREIKFGFILAYCMHPLIYTWYRWNYRKISRQYPMADNGASGLSFWAGGARATIVYIDHEGARRRSQIAVGECID